jgi:paraquat-inducible protein A
MGRSLAMSEQTPTSSRTDTLIFPVLLIAVLSFCLGIFLPVVEVSNLAIFSSRFSIAQAAWELLNDEQYLLGFVVIVFSVVFPLGKILAALVLWQRFRKTGAAPGRWIGRLEFFGRWSCADVLLVAMAIVVAKTSGIADARMEIGLWFFAASIALMGIGVYLLKKATATS